MMGIKEIGQMHVYYRVVVLGLLIAIVSGSAEAAGFSFSGSEQQEKNKAQQDKVAEQQYIQDLLATPGGKGLAGKKTAVIISERHSNGSFATEQSNYGLLFAEINSRLTRLGLRTYSQEEIKAQIRAAETEAMMNNDPDAQISAASKLGASFVLRGLIESRVTTNKIVNVEEVSVTMSFVLVRSNGKVVAQSDISGESYSGSDTLGTALRLVKENADRVVAELYASYCRENGSK